MSILCISGTNTDVGKTIATAALALAGQAQGFEVIPIKPVQTGEPEGEGDATTIERLSGIQGVCLRRYPEPLAPNLSARRAGMQQASVAEICQEITALDRPGRLLLVEGAGGLLVRLNEQESFADLVHALDAPLVIVSSMGLGSLNLAELSVEAARRRGIDVKALIGGSVEASPDLATRLNIEEMPKICHVPLWGVLPEGSGALSREAFAQMARRHLRPDFTADQ
ncbi:dethiobiotin synthase [Corynebacterium pseudopelargi]|uniref:ATP-dependent dethiobiotin synthetase BioD n=1 Tax=Corynebacterium pseudopelargi TaxID=2080757 RepID=A0A3G6IUB5_9CORY|nr:dethiobiotin synthase [Corynebacterium pseudopelargi]AZA09345.1 ATP-dependent dethiobiotin synthetase BioD [Corynebacterium pseudopelargi]